MLFLRLAYHRYKLNLYNLNPSRCAWVYVCRVQCVFYHVSYRDSISFGLKLVRIHRLQVFFFLCSLFTLSSTCYEFHSHTIYLFAEAHHTCAFGPFEQRDGTYRYATLHIPNGITLETMDLHEYVCTAHCTSHKVPVWHLWCTHYAETKDV